MPRINSIIHEVAKACKRKLKADPQGTHLLDGLSFVPTFYISLALSELFTRYGLPIVYREHPAIFRSVILARDHTTPQQPIVKGLIEHNAPPLADTADYRRIPIFNIVYLRSLETLLSAVSQLAQVIVNENQDLLALFSQVSQEEILQEMKVDQYVWQWLETVNAMHPNLWTAFVLYGFLVSQESRFNINLEGAQRLIQEPELLGAGTTGKMVSAYLRMVYNERLIYKLMRVFVRPYAELFAHFSDKPLPADNTSLDNNDIEEVLEEYSRAFAREGKIREKASRYAQLEQQQAEQEPSSSRITPVQPISSPVLDDESIARVEKERERKKEKRKEKEKEKEESEEVQPHPHKKQEHDHKEKQQNTSSEEQFNEQAYPQERVWSLWPTERARFMESFFSVNSHLATHPVFQAFKNPYIGNHKITQQNIDNFFKQIAKALMSFLLVEHRYSKQAIEAFVKDFLKHALGTRHNMHNEGHTQKLPPNYIAHRRGALIIFGVLPSAEFKALGKDGQTYHEKHLARLFEKSQALP